MSDALHPDAENDFETRGLHRRRVRRRAALAGALVLLVVALVFTPPLLNMNRYRKRIATSMSASLGRPVHMGHISLHLLPVPGFTMSDLIVSEDPEFGAEPTIRANRVEARLRFSSLWRRQVEFSTIRFEVDQNGSGPSVNLVRNQQGRWNIESILVHASRIDAAPTAQKTAGEAPRFPYIEATGARVNVKLGHEKLPLSLNDADFALWLPSPQQWRVRLVAKPLRSDTNVADPGTVRLEGQLERAAHLADVPLDLQFSWHNAPLGEASRLITGNDLGWRGTLHLDGDLRGTFGQAAVTTKLTVDELRRADFVPAQLPDLTVNCVSGVSLTNASLSDSTCSMPTSGMSPIVVRAGGVDLKQLRDTALRVDAAALPLGDAFTWLKTLSNRIPASAAPEGSAAVHLSRDAEASWTGTAEVVLGSGAAKPASVTRLDFDATPASADGCKYALTLQPTPVELAGTSELTMNAELSACGYTFHAVGRADAAAVQPITSTLPQLAASLPKLDSVVTPVDVTCTSPWGGTQTCAVAPPPAKPQPRRHHR